HVLDFNRPASAARLAQVAVALGDNSLARQEVLASNAIDKIRSLLQRIGIPERLRDQGVREADLPPSRAKPFRTPPIKPTRASAARRISWRSRGPRSRSGEVCYIAGLLRPPSAAIWRSRESRSPSTTVPTVGGASTPGTNSNVCDT